MFAQLDDCCLYFCTGYTSPHSKQQPEAKTRAKPSNTTCSVLAFEYAALVLKSLLAFDTAHHSDICTFEMLPQLSEHPFKYLQIRDAASAV